MCSNIYPRRILEPSMNIIKRNKEVIPQGTVHVHTTLQCVVDPALLAPLRFVGDVLVIIIYGFTCPRRTECKLFPADAKFR
jgi:hypothetical protein